jgi:hypothetical protein
MVRAFYILYWTRNALNAQNVVTRKKISAYFFKKNALEEDN